MKVGFYGHVRQYENIKSEIDGNMQRVIQSASFVQGPMLAEFEEQAAKYFGTEYAIGVGNGTDALWLSLMSLGIGAGDEVITNANTFFATVEAIWIAGAKAVLVDCDPKTKCIDPAAIEAAVTDKTKAIMPVHLYGQCCDMPAIWDIAEKNGLKVIEDSAQAIDAAGDTFKQGDRSAAVSTSYIIQKNLGCFGDGGMVFTNDADMNAVIRKLRNHGSDARNKHSAGFNSRLDDIQAGVLSAKMNHITAWTDQRIAWAGVYDEGLKDCTSFTLPYKTPGYRHVYHLYVLDMKDEAARDSILAFLQENGVDAKTHYSIAVHQQDGFPWGKEVEIRGSLENSEKNAATCLSLPLYPELTQEEADYVIAKVREWDQANS
jgi:dTDP-4-amino-4,6-dideoxygalactose transaminase